MLTYKQFILKETANDTTKLKHLSHLEDLIFEEGIDGLNTALESIGLYLSVFHKRPSNAKITEKWDGAPSVVIHNSEKDFWVGTKSAFAKDAKLNRTETDIESNHGHAPGLVEKLKYALKYAKELDIKGTIQGDFLYTEDDLKFEKIDGEEFVVFQPNTITYAVPKNSDLGKRILTSKMGIIFHTFYTGSDLESMKANFGYDASKLKKTKNVFVDDANLKNGNVDISLSDKEQSSVDSLILAINTEKKKLKSDFVSYISNHKEISALIAKYNNKNVRSGSYVGKAQAKGFSKYVHEEYQKAVDKLKSEAGKAKKISERDDIIKYLDSHLDQLESLYIIFTDLVSIKSLLIQKLNKTSSIGTFIRTETGLKATTPEGFVGVNDNGRVVKLVDRLEFSRNNFNPVVKGFPK